MWKENVRQITKKRGERMKLEIWICTSCGKRMEVKQTKSNWKSKLSERCSCGGMWKFAKEINDGGKGNAIK